MLLVFTSLFASWENSTLLLHHSDQIHLKNQIEKVIMEAESIPNTCIVKTASLNTEVEVSSCSVREC